MDSQEAYNQLSYYTLSHKDPNFIHQHIVDAYTAQNADNKTKPIAITFALVGLYLYLEKGFTGRQVQLMHMRMAKSRKVWPTFPLPDFRGDITVMDVLDVPPGEARDAKIKQWCKSVGDAYQKSYAEVIKFMQLYLI